MIKIYTEEFIYILREEMSIFDYDFNLIKKESISNVAVYKDNFINIENNIAKIYRKNELYHQIELPKSVENFIINENFIFTFEDTTLTIISLIGNKIVFNGNVAKTKIEKLILKGDLLFIQSEKGIVVLDVLKKKIIFNLNLNIKLFDTDGKNMVVYNDKIVYKIDFNKNVEKQKIEFEIENIRIFDNYIFINKDSNLYLLKDDLKEITNNCYGFDIKDEYLYVLEDKIHKYNIELLAKGDKIKFLTVDDSTTMRLIIKNAIMNNFEDVEVFEAKDGKKAIEVLEENPDINVIFMDWNMPVMNGREAVIKIRENKDYDHIKIIMATTEGGKDKVREMINYGVKGYLVKPLKPTSVVPVVEKMIELVKEERDV